MSNVKPSNIHSLHERSSALHSVDEIVAEIRAGRMVVLVDEEDRENEGDLLMAAQHVTPQAINFMARHARGLVCLTITETRRKQLDLPAMVEDNRAPMGTNFTVSIEAATGVTTGISAADRARTVQAAVARNAKPDDIVQPGHIFPVVAREGGVLVRAGHTEAGCDLAELAGLEPAAVICEVLKENGEMARLPDLIPFAREHGIKIGTIADLIRYRSENERLVERVTTRAVRLPQGEFNLVAYRDSTSGEVHLALVAGTPRAETETLVRVHSGLSVVDFLGADDTRRTFNVPDVLARLQAHGTGVAVLLHHTERGEDLIARLGASDSTERVRKWDPRLHGVASQILRDLGVGKMRVLGRAQRIPSMAGFGLDVVGYIER